MYHLKYISYIETKQMFPSNIFYEFEKYAVYTSSLLGISWVYPQPSNSHHRDKYMFGRESYKLFMYDCPIDDMGVGENKLPLRYSKLGGGFKYVLFSPRFGEDSHFD